MSPQFADLAKRVAALEAQPLPDKAALLAVSKVADGETDVLGANEAVRRLQVLARRGTRPRADQAQPRQPASALKSKAALRINDQFRRAAKSLPRQSSTPGRPAARRLTQQRAIAQLKPAIG
jgi:hypothetical protein